MRLFLRKDYGGLTSQGGGNAAAGGNVAVRSLYLARGFGAVVGISSLLGIVYAYRKLRWYFWFVVIAVALTGVGFMLTTTLNPTNAIDLFVLQRFFLLPLVITAPLFGLGVTWLGQVITDRRPSMGLRRATAGVAMVAIAASLIVVGLNYSTLKSATTTWPETTPATWSRG
jgi:hypothetical protein